METKNSILNKEIHEQPEVFERLIHADHTHIKALAKDIRDKNIKYVLIAARGTSDNAGRYAKYVLGAFNGLIVALAAPSLSSIYQTVQNYEGALVLGISQSGKSPDIVGVLAEAQKQGALTACITNEPHSDMAQVSHHIIDIMAGPEKSVAATKTYTAQLTAVALLSTYLAENDTMLEELKKVPLAANSIFRYEEEIAQLAERYRYMKHCVTIGRGFNYSTAFELALKLKETTYTIAEPYSSADFLHGPVAMLEDGFPVFVIAPTGKMIPLMDQMIATIHQLKGEVIAISDNELILSRAHSLLPLPIGLPEWLSPITAIIPGQLFVMNLAGTRGYPIDTPRSLSKITETK
jgi:glucosamine--fructose-6-phosphate aminotransferase (isomerizing)